MKAIEFTVGITISLLFFVSVAFAGTIERQVHYELKKNEVIFCDEYVASIKFQDQSFACIIEDTLSHKKTFVWNGEKNFLVMISHVIISTLTVTTNVSLLIPKGRIII